MSTIGWVDFSSTDREKVSQVLAMLREPGTLDELGIGQVRDAYADMLFPGFSTIQTRAKYFITIPRMIRDYYALDAKLQRKQALSKYLEEQEHDLAEQLVKRHGDGEYGIIGSSLVGTGKGVARRPSSIYWNGLRQFGLINTRHSLAEFCRQPIMPHLNQSGRLSDDDDEDAMRRQHVVHLDQYDPTWKEHVSIILSASEAQFLADKLRHHDGLKHSVISQILILGLGAEATREDLKGFPALTQWLSNQPQLSTDCRQRLLLAKSFSDAITGAHIRYNVVAALKAGNSSLVEEREEQYDEWHQHVTSIELFKPDCAEDWLQGAAGSGARFKPLTQSFIRQWAASLMQGHPNKQLDQLIEEQARRNKGRRSLLLRNLGNAPKWLGMESLSYRWPSVRIMLGDIMDGLPC